MPDIYPNGFQIPVYPQYNPLPPSEFVRNPSALLQGVNSGMDLGSAIATFGPMLRAKINQANLQAKQDLANLDTVDAKAAADKANAVAAQANADYARQSTEDRLAQGQQIAATPDDQIVASALSHLAATQPGAVSGAQPAQSPQIAVQANTPQNAAEYIAQAIGIPLSYIRPNTSTTPPQIPVSQPNTLQPNNAFNIPVSVASPSSPTGGTITQQGPITTLPGFPGVRLTPEQQIEASMEWQQQQTPLNQSKFQQQLALTQEEQSRAFQEQSRAQLLQQQTTDAAAGKPWRGQPDDWMAVGVDDDGNIVTMNRKDGTYKTLDAKFKPSMTAAKLPHAISPQDLQSGLQDGSIFYSQMDGRYYYINDTSAVPRPLTIVQNGQALMPNGLVPAPGATTTGTPAAPAPQNVDIQDPNALATKLGL